MLSKKFRLTKHGSFNYVYRKGASVHSSSMVISFVPHKSVLKVGFSVSNKIGKAYVRNLVKRRMRSIVGEVLPVFNCCQMVIIAKKGIEELDFWQLKKEINRLLLKANIIKNDKTI